MFNFINKPGVKGSSSINLFKQAINLLLLRLFKDGFALRGLSIIMLGDLNIGTVLLKSLSAVLSKLSWWLPCSLRVTP